MKDPTNNQTGKELSGKVLESRSRHQLEDFYYCNYPN